MVEKKYVYFLS